MGEWKGLRVRERSRWQLEVSSVVSRSMAVRERERERERERGKLNKKREQNFSIWSILF